MPGKGSIRIVAYDPRWPQRFEEERQSIERVLGGYTVAIEHVGSTAVPGLAAKPIIDILVGIRRLDDARFCIAPLASIGYEYVPEYEKEVPDRRYFHKGPSRARTHHLHMAEDHGDFWDRHLLFRDYLRAHPEVAREYEALKRTLARRHRNERETYTDAKKSFIETAVAAARRERGSSA